MAKIPSPAIHSSNQLFARLPSSDYQRLLPRLQLVPLKFKQILHPARAEIGYAYFPTKGMASVLAVMADGRTIEVATVGYEGMVGLGAMFGRAISPNQVIVQVAGEALRIKASDLKAETDRDSSLRRLLSLYHAAFVAQISQGVACNGLHTVRQRCCRWLLESRDRVHSSELGLTHEFLAVMLGVRRASITEVLGFLNSKGWTRTVRGKIIILDADGLKATTCECYRAIADEFKRLFA